MKRRRLIASEVNLIVDGAVAAQLNHIEGELIRGGRTDSDITGYSARSLLSTCLRCGVEVTFKYVGLPGWNGGEVAVEEPCPDTPQVDSDAVALAKERKRNCALLRMLTRCQEQRDRAMSDFIG